MGLGFRVSGLGVRVSGLGFRVCRGGDGGGEGKGNLEDWRLRLGKVYTGQSTRLKVSRILINPYN